MKKVIPPVEQFYARMIKPVTHKTNLTEPEQEAMLQDMKDMMDSYNIELQRMATIIISNQEQEPYRTEMITTIIAERDKKIHDLLNLNKYALKKDTDRRKKDR